MILQSRNLPECYDVRKVLSLIRDSYRNIKVACIDQTFSDKQIVIAAVLFI